MKTKVNQMRDAEICVANLYNKKLRACKSVFDDEKFSFHYVADLGDDKRYIRIRVWVHGEVTRSFLRLMERHYMFFYKAKPLNGIASNLVTFLVNMPSNRQAFVEFINHIAKSRKKLLV